jgi:VCBS repeat-containing protein
VASTGTASGAEDTVINGTAVASDIDSATLTYSLVQQAAHGTVSVNANGSYSYTPQLNYFGADSFTFRASDGSLDSNVATVTLTVTPVNDAPVAVAGTASGAEDTVISGSVAASDVDSATLTYSLVQPASHGTVSLNPDGSYSYTPQPNYNGPDSFTFRASDGSLDSNVATALV